MVSVFRRHVRDIRDLELICEREDRFSGGTAAVHEHDDESRCRGIDTAPDDGLSRLEIIRLVQSSPVRAPAARFRVAGR
jgi:hypothetical protein